MLPLSELVSVHRKRQGMLFLVAVCLLLMVMMLPPSAAEQVPSRMMTQSQDRVLPLDPLTPAEIELASRIATADPRVREALGQGRRQLIAVQFLALKPSIEAREPEEIQIGRHAAVIFYRQEIDQGLHVVVDLEKQSVGAITKMEGKSVPLGDEEVTEAFNLALRNERVRTFLGARANAFSVALLSDGERPESRVEGLRVVAVSPRDPCYRHRCVNLLFRLPEGYIVGTSVTIDLTTQRVQVERTVR